MLAEWKQYAIQHRAMKSGSTVMCALKLLSRRGITGHNRWMPQPLTRLPPLVQSGYPGLSAPIINCDNNAASLHLLVMGQWASLGCEWIESASQGFTLHKTNGTLKNT